MIPYNNLLYDVLKCYSDYCIRETMGNIGFQSSGKNRRLQNNSSNFISDILPFLNATILVCTHICLCQNGDDLKLHWMLNHDNRCQHIQTAAGWLTSKNNITTFLDSKKKTCSIWNFEWFTWRNTYEIPDGSGREFQQYIQKTVLFNIDHNVWQSHTNNCT